MIFLGEALQEHLRERSDIFPALPKRGKGDVDGIDAVVQVFPEPAFADHRTQIHVGGANQADIDRNGL